MYGFTGYIKELQDGVLYSSKRSTATSRQALEACQLCHHVFVQNSVVGGVTRMCIEICFESGSYVAHPQSHRFANCWCGKASVSSGLSSLLLVRLHGIFVSICDFLLGGSKALIVHDL